MANIEEHDTLSYWRCPPLGGPVPFKHCRKVNGGLPCNRIINCWSGKIDLADYLRENFTGEEIEKALAAPGMGRLDTILDAISKAARGGHEKEGV